MHRSVVDLFEVFLCFALNFHELLSARNIQSIMPMLHQVCRYSAGVIVLDIQVMGALANWASYQDVPRYNMLKGVLIQSLNFLKPYSLALRARFGTNGYDLADQDNPSSQWWIMFEAS